MDRRVYHLKSVLKNDLTHDWSAEEIAHQVNVSVSHLSRLFKSEAGLSPVQFLREMRLERAAELLQDSFLSIKEIRFRVGFCDKSAFIKCFMKKYGMTPSEYRKRYEKPEQKQNFN